jgi:hypothetical protein
MSTQKLYRLTCNEDDCESVGPVALTEEAAKIRAKEYGWDVGPHRRKNRSGGVVHYTDYCSEHKGAEDR